MLVLGISCLYHDSAAALLEDGFIIAAAQEERFSRVKNDASFPVHAIKYCLNYKNIVLADVDAVVYYDNPMDTLDRFLCNVLAAGSESKELIEFQYDQLFRKRLWVNEILEKKFGKISRTGKLLIAGHHLSHGASAFYPSPFTSAAILTIDGVGEWNTTTIGFGDKNGIQLLKKIDYPHSLGMLYSAFTYFCGFKVNSGEYKLMGLAPYGKAVYYDLIMTHLIDVKPDGSFRLNLDYFDFQYGKVMTNNRFGDLFGAERRIPESEITKIQMDLAASIQKVAEEIIRRLARTAYDISGGNDNLVMAGGIALNCVANGILLREKQFKNIWIQPAAGDSGGAVGAAYLGYHQYLGQKRVVIGERSINYSYLGPEYSDQEIEQFLKISGASYHKYENCHQVAQRVAQIVAEGNVVGLFEGRMEFGPRALGNRSIIADARDEGMQSRVNRKIKFRESFRPFAPAVMEEHANNYFKLDCESPYMLFCGEINDELKKPFNLQEDLELNHYNMISAANFKKSEIPAVTHVDYSARIQTVNKNANGFFYEVLAAFYRLTGCAVLVNTSFNVRGEPIVCTPADAYTCFMRTDMDCLVMNNCILYKSEQQEYQELVDWRKTYELD